MGKMKTDNHLIPEFGALRLDAITDTMIDAWLLSFIKRGYSPATGNNCFKFLSVMLGWAVHEKLITENPCKKVKFLLQKDKKRELLCADEIKGLFGDGWETYWGKYIYCLINKLAACCGMRIGEILGLKGAFVTPKGIIVSGQYTKYGYQDTKNHKTRFTPVTSKVIEELELLKKQTGNGYLFSLDGGNTPVSQSAVTDALKNALEMIGIDRAEQKRRGLSFHSWRHFANTSMRLADVSIVKIQEAIGHLTMDMTDNYTQISNNDLDEIATVQERLLTAPKGKKAAKKKVG
jgi:integrase